MSTVGVKELKNRLTQYLRRVRQGEEVVVTDRGKPVALIQAMQAVERPASLDARLAKLAAQGLVTLPSRPPLRKLRPARVAGRPVSKVILDDRR